MRSVSAVLSDGNAYAPGRSSFADSGLGARHLAPRLVGRQPSNVALVALAGRTDLRFCLGGVFDLAFSRHGHLALGFVGVFESSVPSAARAGAVAAIRIVQSSRCARAEYPNCLALQVLQILPIISDHQCPHSGRMLAVLVNRSRETDSNISLRISNVASKPPLRSSVRDPEVTSVVRERDLVEAAH